MKGPSERQRGLASGNQVWREGGDSKVSLELHNLNVLGSGAEGLSDTWSGCLAARNLQGPHLSEAADSGRLTLLANDLSEIAYKIICHL